jgi:ABC-type Fe3+-hydroxamate transport system substrate-binding protein
MVPDCEAKGAYISAQVSAEQLLAYDPDIILTIEVLATAFARAGDCWSCWICWASA